MALLSELEALYQALGSPIGAVFRTSDPHLAKQRLYRAKREGADPALDRLQIRSSPYEPESEIWIVKGKANGNGAASLDGPTPVSIPTPAKP